MVNIIKSRVPINIISEERPGFEDNISVIFSKVYFLGRGNSPIRVFLAFQP